MANTEDLKLLEELLLARGPGGQEDEVRRICLRELKRSCDEVWVDAADNVIGGRAGHRGDFPGRGCTAQRRDHGAPG